MTSHIFIALGMWDDVVKANVRALRTVPYLVGHSVHWLAYGLIQQGRYREAERWLDSIATQARTTDTLPFQFGPPTMINPPREVAGELLLELRRPAVLLGLARAAKAQDHAADAAHRYGELVEIWAHADLGITEVAEARKGAT